MSPVAAAMDLIFVWTKQVSASLEVTTAPRKSRHRPPSRGIPIAPGEPIPGAEKSGVTANLFYITTKMILH